MNNIIQFSVFVVICLASLSSPASINSITGLLNTCLIDSNCNNAAMFCDHTGINPMGSCAKKHKNGEKCKFDRHCMSSKCNWNKCVASKPKKDGPCSKGHHEECIDTQYCNKNKCKDRQKSGTCSKDQECLSNKCTLFRCSKPQNITVTTTTIAAASTKAGKTTTLKSTTTPKTTTKKAKAMKSDTTTTTTTTTTTAASEPEENENEN